MPSWKSVLKSDPTKWLLGKDNPSVRYFALRDILGRSEKDSEVADARDVIMDSKPVRAILSKQSSGGYWGQENNIYLPKYRATTHSLLILAGLGAGRNRKVETAVEHVFRFQLDSGHFMMTRPKTARGRASKLVDGACLTGNILRYLVHFGYLNDPRTQKTVDFLVNSHTKEGGWMCRAYPIDPGHVFPKNCYMGAVKPMLAFAAIPRRMRSSEMEKVIRANTKIFLENRVFRYLKNPDGSRKAKLGWTRFGFPLFYQSDALEVLDLLTSFGVKDKRMDGAIELVLGAQEPDGKWLMKNTYNGKMWTDIEKKNVASKWVTLRAMRVLKRFYS